MLYEEPNVQEMLRRVAYRVNCDPAWADDLMQEATIHLWLTEKLRPGQTLSWYVQSCRFHLLNLLSSGRSVDSHKRRQRLVPLCGTAVSDAVIEGWEGLTAVFQEVSSDALVDDLRQWLTPSERKVLHCLADGLGIQETARRLGISHQAVSKHRRHIAAQAGKLGMNPPNLPSRIAVAHHVAEQSPAAPLPSLVVS